MKKRRKKIVFIFLAVIFCFLLVVFGLSVHPPSGISKSPKWYAAFSKPFAIQMGLDWRETYLAILDDLKPESLRLPLYWPEIEPQKDKFVFEDYDWMIKEAEKRNVSLVLVVGQKLPRWPECHTPDWLESESSSRGLAEKNERLLQYIEKSVSRYKTSPALRYFQVENEPFLSFGECPGLDVGLLNKEISLVKLLDPNHKIMITDSGELSIWLRAASRADIFGTTMYRVVWNKYLGNFKYPLPPKFFWLKANLVRLFYPQKPIIVSELQAEPWGPKLIYETRLDDQFKSMNLTQFSDNIEYAKAVGFPEVYLWGAEWWWWLKTKQSHPEFWDYARQIISLSS